MKTNQLNTQNAVDESKHTSTGSFVRTFIGLLAGLFAGLISIVLIFIRLMATSGTEPDAIVLVGFVALSIYIAPVYWVLFIVAVVLGKKSIKNQYRKDLRVMGWIGVLFATTTAAVYLAVGSFLN